MARIHIQMSFLEMINQVVKVRVNGVVFSFSIKEELFTDSVGQLFNGPTPYPTSRSTSSNDSEFGYAA